MTTARIAVPTLETAPEATRPMLAALKANIGFAPNLFATIGHSPVALQFLLAGMETLSKGSLSGREIEQINLFTSELNGCAYCVTAHAGLARKGGMSADDVGLARQGRSAVRREQAIFDLVRRVVRTGGYGAGTELALAREAGLTDSDIVEVFAHVALKAFTNAVAIVGQTPLDFPAQPRLPTV